MFKVELCAVTIRELEDGKFTTIYTDQCNPGELSYRGRMELHGRMIFPTVKRNCNAKVFRDKSSSWIYV